MADDTTYVYKTHTNWPLNATDTTSTNWSTIPDDMFLVLSTADKAIEIFTKPIEIISVILCIVGLVANAASIIATANIPHRQSTHSKLIISLGVSDALILVAILSHNVMYIFSSWDDCTKMLKRLLLDVALLATLVNLLVMAIDHYLAIMRPLHYRRFMSKFRGNCLVVGIWVFSLAAGLLEVVVGLLVKFETHEPFCRVISNDEFDLELLIIAFIFIVLFGIMVIYMRIYILVKELMVRDRILYQDEMHSSKAIITTMAIVGTFAIFWAPDGIFQIYMYVQIKRDIFYVLDHLNAFALANDILFLCIQLNSLADPLIYAIRLREVQRGYKAVFYKLFPHRRSLINEEQFLNRNLLSTSQRTDTIPTIVVHENNVASVDGAHDTIIGKDSERMTDESSFIDQQL